MEAGTGLLWREEGILVVTIKKTLSMLCKALVSLVEVCSMKEVILLAVAEQDWQKIWLESLSRIKHLQLGVTDAPTCCLYSISRQYK